MSIFETRLILLGYDVSVATRPKRFSIFWMTTSKSITKATGHLSDCSCTRPGSKSRDTSTVMKSNKVHSVDSPCFGFFCCCFFFAWPDWLRAGFWTRSLHSTTFTSPPSKSWSNGPRTRGRPTLHCFLATSRPNLLSAPEWSAATNRTRRLSLWSATWTSATAHVHLITRGMEISTDPGRPLHGPLESGHSAELS